MQIKDRRVFEALSPLDLTGYLRATGWTEVSYRPEHSTIWTKDHQGETAELLLPLNRRFGDFGLRMADAVGLVAALEDRSQLAVLDDIQNASRDVIRFQLTSADVQQGSIPADRGVAMYDNIPELFSASASATQQPRVYYPTKGTKAVSDYLRTLRLGQTEQGSYVIRVLASVPPPLGDLFGPTEEPFERQVIHTLFRSLVALNQAAERSFQGDGGKPFAAAIQQGVSANLCEACANVLGLEARPGESLGIHLTPARNRPIAAHIPPSVLIPAERVPVIREAARVLKANAPLEAQEIRGYVVKLQARDQGGIATISTYIDGQPRKVAVTLSEEEHKKAIQAYEQRAEILCRGDLTRAGQLWSLSNPSPITILNDD